MSLPFPTGTMPPLPLAADPPMPDLPPDFLGMLGGLGGGGQMGAGILEPPDIPSPRNDLIRARIKPYKLRKFNDGKPTERPKVEWITAEAKRRKDYWGSRDRRMDLDEALYLLSDASEETVNGEERIRRVTPRATVDKLSFMVGRQKTKLSVKPRASGRDYQDAAQNVEDFLYEADNVFNSKHIAGLNMKLGRDEAWHAAQRGWLAGRVCLDPEDDDFPFTFMLMDARNIYPQPGRAGPGFMLNVIYCERTDKGRFIAQNLWADDNSYVASLDNDDEIDVVWYEDSYWSVVLVDDMLIRSEKHNYGFCPWAITVSGGAPIKTDLARGQFGSGIITPLRHTIGHVDRLLSAVATDINRFGNPPTLRIFNSTEGGGRAPEPLDLRPGANNIIDKGKGQDYQIMSVVRNPSDVQLLYQAMDEDIQKQGLVGSLWGNAEGLASGFQQSVAINAAEDALFPVTDAIIQFRQMRNELLLNLVLVASEEGILSRDATEGDGQASAEGITYQRKNREPGARARSGRNPSPTTFGVLTPDDIKKHGVRNTVLLRRMTPQDLMQMVQAGAMAVNAKLLSIEHVRSEWLDVDDPVGMNLEVMYELIYQDEDMMREYFMPMVLKYLDPELYSYYLRKEEERKAKEDAAAQSASMGGGQPPMAGPEGIPSQMLPPPMQAQPMPGAGDMAAFEALLPQMMNEGMPLPI